MHNYEVWVQIEDLEPFMVGGAPTQQGAKRFIKKEREAVRYAGGTEEIEKRKWEIRKNRTAHEEHEQKQMKEFNEGVRLPRNARYLPRTPRGRGLIH